LTEREAVLKGDLNWIENILPGLSAGTMQIEINLSDLNGQINKLSTRVQVKTASCFLVTEFFTLMPNVKCHSNIIGCSKRESLAIWWNDVRLV
jgi:hypothetical protein